ncbi:hypothetical protein GDO78_017767 [Eleutherodactylus coqui]|uniref:Uncharacterized protein n=1 Tax=Eleutherodactylus coqui TaxID=57060 RepID=A0A8J6BIL7_ELECQ|nr:hypothetical protein GDO78_017767 [Eleutherodactylus coqui]
MLKYPEMFSQDRLWRTQIQLSDLLTHLTPYQTELPGTISVVDIPSTEWNLCTMFGFLLHYHAVYLFDTTKNFENCLSFTPLKRITVETTCCQMGLHKLQVYSFTIPESVYQTLQSFLQAWTEHLRPVSHEPPSLGGLGDLEIGVGRSGRICIYQIVLTFHKMSKMEISL